MNDVNAVDGQVNPDDLRQDLRCGDVRLVAFANLEQTQSRQVFEMRTHEAVASWMTTGASISWADHQRFMDRQAQESSNFNFLCLDEVGVVGVGALHRWDRINAIAWLGMYKSPFRSERGLGRKILSAISSVGFGVGRLHSLKLEVADDNAPAIKLYKGFGFVMEGRWREALLQNGVRRDLLLMGLLSQDIRAALEPALAERVSIGLPIPAPEL